MSETLAPGNLPLIMRRGSTFGPISIFCKTGLGGAFDLTGYNAFMVARPEVPSPNSLNLNPSITAGVTGEIVVTKTDEQTQRDFPAGEYIYDLVLESSGGVRGAPTLAGRLTVLDDTSRV